MIVCEKIDQVREQVAGARSKDTARIVGLVPTMGALHAGHLSLIDAARMDCGWVVVSIFVNPTQFGPNEDIDKYPRPIREDLEKCRASGVDLVFQPSVEVIYGSGCDTTVQVNAISMPLCGRHRPGHFAGVSLVVTKLLNIVQPDRAYFGQKDAQQLAVIRRLVYDLNMPVEIIGCPTVREPDGLALSSRNAYLNEHEREQATVLYRSLRAIRDAIEGGSRDSAALARTAGDLIEQSGPCEIDYVELVDPQSMQPFAHLEDGLVLAAVAVRFGECRLIDNLLIDVPHDRG
ncbi:MAG: pantoate--beta-alanine ligase [Planctomycetes bacterium]|nr:pantoate--beta-alanine ligase [Planctomycetota bacterium]